jgi:hypothetical protein
MKKKYTPIDLTTSNSSAQCFSGEIPDRSSYRTTKLEAVADKLCMR